MTRPQYGAGHTPLAIAHRGGAGLAAENTLDAFARSYALGVRYLETDVRMSADGVCLAFHDATLDRVLGRPGLVRTSVRADLPGIPTVAEVLRAFPDAYLTIDLKDEVAIAPLAKTLLEADAAHRVCAAGAWDGWLTRLRDRVGPELTTALGWRALATLLASAPTGVIPPWWHEPGRFAHVPERLASPLCGRLLARAHALGVRVIVWTVNEPARMHRLLDAGVDGIISDRPDLLRDVLISRDQWTPPESDDRVSEAGSGLKLPS